MKASLSNRDSADYVTFPGNANAGDLPGGDWRIRADRVFVRDVDLAALADFLERGCPGADLLGEGRNRVLRSSLAKRTGPGAYDVAVKAFPARRLLEDRIAARRGTKARRAFDAAAWLRTRGVGTPRPLACLEHWEGRRLAGSWLITEFVESCRDFKTILVEYYRTGTECAVIVETLEKVARAIRRMHDAGFQHRDLGNQNILLADDGDGVLFMDLNRGRMKTPFRLSDRGRDLSRITLPSDLRRVFLDMYWEEVPPPRLLASERRARRRFAVHTATRRWRHPIRERRRKRKPVSAGYPAENDLWIWDSRSAQAVPALTSRSRRRYYPPTRGPVIAGAFCAALPRQLRAFFRVRRETFNAAPDRPLTEGIVVGLSARRDGLDRKIGLLRELGLNRVLVRFYHHAGDAERQEALEVFDRLSAAGVSLCAALVQDRRAVRAPDLWEAFCRGVLGHIRGRVEWVEFGHAINRVKWGLWGFADYRRLCRGLPGMKRAFPEIVFCGPAVIDFDPAFALAALRALPPGFRWTALSNHLYVDRRGAPENRQGMFDLLGKLEWMRATARGAGVEDDRVIVSEFNWPLAGTGVWSPVGSPYVSPGERRNDPSVSEEDAARFLVRYVLLALASGQARDCVIWRLVAHGFGLVDDPPEGGGLRRRPAFRALHVLMRLLDGMVFERALTPCRAPGIFALAFSDPATGARAVAAWAHPAAGTFTAPFVPGTAVDAFGRDRPLRTATVPLDGTPLFLLERAARSAPVSGA